MSLKIRLHTPTTVHIQEADMCEMAMVGRNVKDNFVVYVNSDPNHLGNEYIKFYNHQVYGKADCVARIAMRRSDYIIHSNDDGKKNIRLNTKEKKALIQLLKSPNKKVQLADGSSASNWQAAIVCINQDYGMEEEDTIRYMMNSPKKGDYLHIDEPMPDYLKLPSPK